MKTNRTATTAKNYSPHLLKKMKKTVSASLLPGVRAAAIIRFMSRRRTLWAKKLSRWDLNLILAYPIQVLWEQLPAA